MVYIRKETLSALPRIPFEGSIDLTYRCNNRCRHCWLWEPAGSPLQQRELTFDEIRRIVDEARAMGCQRWSISGGEPMLRHDFPEIFDYITQKSVSYSINTNGTLITPQIAQMLKRKGNKMIALYGATPQVYDHITQHPGGFEMVMQGIHYLQEAGAGFIIQLVPMQGNYHQWDEMITLAKQMSPRWRVGASWLWLSQNSSLQRNQEILGQRLPPNIVIDLDKPDLPSKDLHIEQSTATKQKSFDENCLFARCIENRRDFHIDAYGGLSWCSFIKDPVLRFDLLQGSFKEAWEIFIPSCVNKVCADQEWNENCGSCELRSDCRWCAVYAFLETGRYTAPIPYLCEVAKETRRYNDDRETRHRRYFQVAGITVCVESDVALDRGKFKDELLAFSVEGPGEDNVRLQHHFEPLDLRNKSLGKEVYKKAPWVIYHKDGTWIYRKLTNESTSWTHNFLSRKDKKGSLLQLAVFNSTHTQASIYSYRGTIKWIEEHGFPSLSLFPTDQIWLSPLLADRHAVLLHSASAIINGAGLVFVGHSEAGKSTTMELLKHAKLEDDLDVEILCDDRNVIRKWPEGWQVHGTWSHGTIADVSPASASLKGIFFIEKAHCNEINKIEDPKQIWLRLLATLVRPLMTAEWLHKELDTLSELVADIPCYQMRFDKSGKIVGKLVNML